MPGLENYAGKSVYPNHGERVVNGHRLMQPASDIFLGRTEGGIGGRHYYVRQLRDVKIKLPVETYDKSRMIVFVECCGHSLALSHARSGDAAVMSGYMGKSDVFDKSLAAFSVAYADQMRRTTPRSNAPFAPEKLRQSSRKQIESVAVSVYLKSAPCSLRFVGHPRRQRLCALPAAFRSEWDRFNKGAAMT